MAKRQKTYALIIKKRWIRNWKIIQRNGEKASVFGLEEYFKCSCHPVQSTDFMKPLSKYPWHFHVKFLQNHKRPWTIQSNLEKWTNLEVPWLHAHVVMFPLYYQAAGVKTVRYWHIKSHIDQWNNIESNPPPQIPCTYAQLVYDKGANGIQWIKVFWISRAEKSGKLHVKMK